MDRRRAADGPRRADPGRPSDARRRSGRRVRLGQRAAAHRVEVPAFTIDVHAVTNRDYLEFVEAGGYEREDLWDADGWRWRADADMRHPLFWEIHRGAWFWRGMCDLIPLPLAWPVYVTHAEASAYARWKGRRLPTEAEYHRAAYGEPGGGERLHPWGDEPPDATRGNFDFARGTPFRQARSRAARAPGASTTSSATAGSGPSTVFAPFEGFVPMPSYPEYSADFFDGQALRHEGRLAGDGARARAAELPQLVPPDYPYVYAKFRTVGR